MIIEKRENIFLKLKYWINEKKHEKACQPNYLIDSIVPLFSNIESVPESEINDEVIDMAYDTAYYIILIIEYLEHNLVLNKSEVR